MMIYTTLLVAAMSWSHQGFKNLNCLDGPAALKISKSQGKHNVEWKDRDGKATTGVVAQWQMADEMGTDKKQVLDVYTGSMLSWSLVIKRPETKGPQKTVKAQIRDKKTKSLVMKFETCDLEL